MRRVKSLIEREEEFAGQGGSISYKPPKSIFLALLFAAAFILIAAGFLFWYIPVIGLYNIHPNLPLVFGMIVSALIIMIILSVFAVTIAVVNGRDVFRSYKLRGILIKLFLPLMVLLGSILKIPRIKIERAFIDVNNQLVTAMGRMFKPEKVLILMPHCIQYTNCKIKVTQDIRNCSVCGMCEIKDLLNIMNEFGIDIYVLTGGTIARRKVYEKKPDVIVAVACERDLTSGIQDAYPIPVVGIVNKRPQGYCIGTGVDVSMVRGAIEMVLGRV